MRILILIIGCFFSFHANAELHKCKGADGSFSYQDRACPPDKIPEADFNIQGRTGPMARDDAGGGFRNMTKEQKNNGWGCHKMPKDRKALLIGLTSVELVKHCHIAWTINRSVNAGHVREQWVYDDEYFYLEDGVVTSFQD
jgi:hypothetical protein